MSVRFEKYDTIWNSDNPILIEHGAIIRGGRWKNKEGKVCGLGLFQHYKNLQSLYWPQKVWHRWNDLQLSEFVENKYVAVMGSASSGKTREASDYALTRYSVFPKNTTVLMSSTGFRELNLRIWGETKKNILIARENWPDFPGNITDSRQMVTTDGREIEGRDGRNGIICIPCLVGGQYQGLGKYVGVKNDNVILIADELPMMGRSFMDSISNLNKNKGFQVVGLGNPKDRTDPLGLLAEPKDGWESINEEEVTKTWRTRYGGVCVQLVGTDSPNFDDPPNRYPFLIGQKEIEYDLALYGRESLQFSMMNLGMMPKDSSSRRVITRSMCQQFKAMEEPFWGHDPIIKIGCLDAAYSSVGGDRCVFMELNMGRLSDGTMVIGFKGSPVLVPIRSNSKAIPEDQIAQFVTLECTSRGIPPGNLFYDATGRGSLGTSFARIWSNAVNPLEFGGKPSDRPVSQNNKTPCNKFYFNFVTELWYATRLAIEAGQIRGLPEDVMAEGCMREWTIVAGNKVQVEPKDKTKLRMGRSPDLYDCFVTGLEGCRRKGFVIASNEKTRKQDMNWLKELTNKRKELLKKTKLVSA